MIIDDNGNEFCVEKCDFRKPNSDKSCKFNFETAYCSYVEKNETCTSKICEDLYVEDVCESPGEAGTKSCIWLKDAEDGGEGGGCFDEVLEVFCMTLFLFFFFFEYLGRGIMCKCDE
jgi:hypothetical protein